jgi:hypothetical protein
MLRRSWHENLVVHIEELDMAEDLRMNGTEVILADVRTAQGEMSQFSNLHGAIGIS